MPRGDEHRHLSQNDNWHNVITRKMVGYVLYERPSFRYGVYSVTGLRVVWRYIYLSTLLWGALGADPICVCQRNMSADRMPIYVAVVTTPS